jgi:hypothetical protein
MQPDDNRREGAQLNGLLREWEIPDPPPSLDQRVLRSCRPPWWRILFTGYIRVPVALVYVVGVLLAVTVWKVAAHAPVAPCVAEARGASVNRPARTPSPSHCDHPAPGIC